MAQQKLTAEQTQQLDSNIKSMLSSGATEEDIMSYAKDFNSKFTVKKKEDTQEASSSLDTDSPLPESNEQVAPVKLSPAEQIYSDNNGPQALKELQDARLAKQQDPDILKKAHDFEQEIYTPQDRRGLPADIGDSKAEEVEIEGFDNEKMIEFNNRLFQSGMLNEEEIVKIDKDFQRKRTGELTFGEKANLLLNPFVKEDDYRNVTMKDRDNAVADKILQKQSDFFKGLTPEEIPEFKSYISKRNDNLSEKFTVAESFNQKLVDNILDPERERLSGIESQLKAIKNTKEITQDDIDEYNHLVGRYQEGVEKLKPAVEQYEINRKILSNSSDDLLSFDNELNLAKRDYDQFKFMGLKPYNIAKGFQYLGENAVSFTGGLIADATEQFVFGVGRTSTPMDKVQSMMDDYSRDINKRKSEHDEGIPLKRRFQDVNNASDFGEYFFSMVDEQIPILTTIALTGGAGLGIVSAGAGGDRYGSLLNSNNGASRAENKANAIMYGAGEYVGERITLGILRKYKRVIRSKNIDIKSFREGIKRASKNSLKGLSTANQEGMSEVYTKYIQGLADIVIFEDDKGIKSSPLEEYASGFFIGGGIHVAASIRNGAGALTHKAIGAYSNSKNKKKVLSNTKQIMEFENILKQEGLDQGAKDYYTSKVKELTRSNNKIINVSAKNIDNLDPASFIKVAQINERIRSLEVSGEQSNNNEFQKTVRKEVKILKHNKDQIINESNSKEYNKLSPKEKLPYIEQANRELLDSNVLSDFTITEEDTVAKAAQIFNEDQNKETVTKVEVSMPDSYKEKMGKYKQSDLGGADGSAKADLVEEAETEDGKKFVQQEVETLEKNEDGTITLYRSGSINEGHIPFTTDKKMAETLAKERKTQGLSDNIISVNVKPEDISVVVTGIEGEALVKVDKNNKIRISETSNTEKEGQISKDIDVEIEKTKKELIGIDKAIKDGKLPDNDFIKESIAKKKSKIKNLEKQKARQKNKPYTTKEVSETKDAKLFSEAQKKAIYKRKEDKLQVDILSEKDAQKIVDKGGKLFITEDGNAGAYVKKDGYMGGLFKDPTANRSEAAKVLQEVRVKSGGKFFDAFATHLEDIYVKNGFRPIARMDFNEKEAPDNWRESNLKTKPDNVFFVYDPAYKSKVGEGERINDYNEAYELAKNYNGSGALSKTAAKKNKTVHLDNRTDDQKNSDIKSEKRYREEIEEKFINDGEGNYIFRNYSHEERTDLKPSTTKGNLIMSKGEQQAINSVGGVVMFYTEEGQKEIGVGDILNEVKVQKDKVYILQSDVDGFYDEAKKQFTEKFPKQAFTPNHQAAWIGKIANENGYDILVSKWGKGFRAQTTIDLSSKKTDSKGQEVNKNVKTAEERLINALNNKFTKGVVDFDPNSKGSKDAELASALIEYVKAKLAQGVYSMKQLARDIKTRGFKMKDKHIKALYQVAVDEGKTGKTLKEANAIVKDLAENNTKEAVIKKLKSAKFTDNIIEIAVTKGFVKSVIANSKGKGISRASVGLIKAMDKIRVAYNQGGKDKAKSIRVATKSATDIIFKTIKGKANLNDVKSLISKVRDINEKNFDKKIQEIEDTIEKIAQRTIDQVYVSKTDKVIKNVRSQNKKGRYDVNDNPNLRSMITQITGLKAIEVPKELRAEFAAILTSIASYKRTGTQPFFSDVLELYESLIDTFITKAQVEEAKAEMEIENAEDTQANKEEKEAEDKAHYLSLVNELLKEGYNKDSFDPFDRGQLFKLHQYLKNADLNIFNSNYLKKIAIQLQQTKKGSNEWMPVTEVTKLVMDFKAREDTKGMEKESFSKKVVSVMGSINDYAESLGKSGKSVEKEANRFDNIMKGYISSFSGLFKNQKFSYNGTVGMMVAGEATIDSRKDMFAKNFESLLRKVKGNDYNNQMKLSLYALEKRKLANPKNKRIFSAKDHMDATLATAKNENVGDIRSVWDKWVNNDGNIDVNKIESSLTPAEKKLVDFINLELSKSNERRKHVAKHYEGATAEDIDWYTPIRTKKGKTLSETLEVSQESSGALIGASNKALQATKAVPIRLDYFRIIKSHVESSIEYEVMMPIFKQLEATEKEMNKSSNKSVLDWSRILFGGLTQKGLIARHLEASNLQTAIPTEASKFASTVYSNLMKSMLVGAKRFVVDAGINQVLSKSFYGNKMIKGSVLRKKNNSGKGVSRDAWMTDLMETYNSEQAGRFAGAHTTDGRGVRSGLENKASYQTKNRNVFQYINDKFRFNFVNRSTDKSLGWYYKGSDQPAMEVWRAFFTQSFPKFDIGAYMGKDKLDYRDINDANIKDAIALADKMTGIFYNTPSSAAEKTNTIRNKRAGIFGQGNELLLGFKYNERHALQTAIFSLLPHFVTKQGNLGAKDALKVAVTISTRAVVYSAAQAYLGGFIVNSLIGSIPPSEEDKEKEAMIMQRALAQFGAFIFLGNKGAYSTIAYELAIEGFLSTMAKSNEQEYNKLLYAGKPSVQDLGLFGIAVENSMKLTEQAWGVYEKQLAGEELTSEDRNIILEQQAIVAVLGTFFGIKWEAIPKIQKRIYEENKK